MKLKYINLMAAALFALSACQPDDYSLGAKSLTPDDLAEGIAFDYTIDQKTNAVSFRTLDIIGKDMTVCWDLSDAGFGYKQQRDVTINIPFDGDYTVFFGLITPGGYVRSDTIRFHIDNINGDLLTHEAWTLLTGGSGKSKTWVLDLDKDGVSKYFSGPLYFYGTDDWYGNVSGSYDALGTDSWNWQAGWSDNTWMTGDAWNSAPYDFGTMTFDLKNGAHAIVEDTGNGSSSGTFQIDTDNYTIDFTNAKMLHLPSYDGVVISWSSDLRIYSLTEHTLQIAALRDAALSGEDACRLVFNFISLEAYNDPSLLVSSEAPAESQPVVDIEVSDLETSLFTIVGDDATYLASAVTYLMNEDVPYNWMWWNGGSAAWESNDFSGGYNGTWAPTPGSDVSDFALILEKSSDGKLTFTDENAGITGTFAISGNKLTFSQPITFLKAESSVRTVLMETSEVYVIKADNKNNSFYFAIPDGTDATGAVNQYLYVELVQKSIGGGATGPTNLIVDNSALLYGDIEGKGNLRIELYNAYGSGSKDNPPFTPEKLKFKKQMVITFTVSGIGKLNNPCVATIGTGLDWAFDGSSTYCGNASITGDGTYKVTYNSDGTTKLDLSSFSEVFVIDMLGVGTQLSSDALGDSYVDHSQKDDPGEGKSYLLDPSNAGTAFTITIDSITLE